MPIFKVSWKLATEIALYSGEYIVVGDDSEHALERAKTAIGPEASASNFSVEELGSTIYELKRRESLVGCEVYSPTPDSAMGRDLFAFEIAARANVIASTEKVAFERMCSAIKSGGADGKYCTLLKTAVLEREGIYGMSRAERNALNKSFIRVQGGGVNPR